MRNLGAAKKYIDQGLLDEALQAVDSLLELGPTNKEALHMKAKIYSSQARFSDAAKIWFKVLRLDPEDEKANEFIIKQQIEDREHFYFTDPINEGGRRYLAFPQKLLWSSMIGLAGCFSFFLLTRLAMQDDRAARADVLLIGFLCLVMLPWVQIVITWAKSLRGFCVMPGGLRFESRFKDIRYLWHDIDSVVLAHSGDLDDPNLDLVVIPKQASAAIVVMDLSEGSSSLRARTHLVSELSKVCPNLSRASLEGLGISQRRSLYF